MQEQPLRDFHDIRVTNLCFKNKKKKNHVHTFWYVATKVSMPLLIRHKFMWPNFLVHRGVASYAAAKPIGHFQVRNNEGIYASA